MNEPREPLRRTVEGYLAAHRWEQNHTARDPFTGVVRIESWLAPSAGYDDGINDITTMEALADQMRREREAYTDWYRTMHTEGR